MLLLLLMMTTTTTTTTTTMTTKTTTTTMMMMMMIMMMVMRLQMENIQTFVNFCEAYGVTRTSLFQTVDLYDGRNMSQVISCIQQLGSEVYIVQSFFNVFCFCFFYIQHGCIVFAVN